MNQATLLVVAVAGLLFLVLGVFIFRKDTFKKYASDRIALLLLGMSLGAGGIDAYATPAKFASVALLVIGIGLLFILCAYLINDVYVVSTWISAGRKTLAQQQSNNDKKSARS